MGTWDGCVGMLLFAAAVACYLLLNHCFAIIFFPVSFSHFFLIERAALLFWSLVLHRKKMTMCEKPLGCAEEAENKRQKNVKENKSQTRQTGILFPLAFLLYCFVVGLDLLPSPPASFSVICWTCV